MTVLHGFTVYQKSSVASDNELAGSPSVHIHIEFVFRGGKYDMFRADRRRKLRGYNR